MFGVKKGDDTSHDCVEPFFPGSAHRGSRKLILKRSDNLY